MNISLRQNIAGRTPAIIRKSVRMGEHYLRRHVAWIEIFLAMSGVHLRDKITLLLSACICPLTSLAKLDGFQSPVLIADIAVSVKGIGKFKLRRGTDDIIHVMPGREPLILQHLRNLLRPGDLFVDAGANIGFFTITAANIVGEKGKVVAVEMMPPTYGVLASNVALNNATNVEMVDRALSDKGGEIVVANTIPGKFGQASIVTNAQIGMRTIRHEVSTVRLDDVLKKEQRVTLMKMDLEGAEYLALKGTEKAIGLIDAIIFETNDEDDRIFKFLEENGFSLSRLDGHDYLARRK